MNQTVGILAYGSLIWDHGQMNIDLKSDRRQVWTPFNVEFARVSGLKKKGIFGSRGGAPTLVPVPIGHGKQVKAKILLHNTSIEKATEELFLREGGDPKPNYEINYKYDCIKNVSQEIKIHKNRRIFINCLLNFEELECVLFAQLGTNIEGICSNIQKLTPEHLACLAIVSVKNACAKEDGITYLDKARQAGIETCLSRDYAKMILEMTDTESECLIDAVKRVKCRPEYYAKAEEKLMSIRDNL